MSKRKGMDVSVYQGNVDFKAAKKDGIEFVIIRLGYGRKNLDSKFERNVVAARDAGVAIDGIYHFSYALTVEDAVKEAEFAVEQATKAGLPKSTVIFYDFEYDSVNYGTKNGVRLGKDECMKFTEAFCERVKALGYKPGVYFNQDYYKNMYTPMLLNSYVRWLADYEGEPNYDCEYQQYSSKGKVNGISGDVDLDYSFVDNSSKEIKMEPKKSNEEIAKEVWAGKWGNGDARKKALTNAGYDFSAVQKIVDATAPTKKTVAFAQSFKESLTGTYTTTVMKLNVRYEPGKLTNDNIAFTLPIGAKVQNYGYYTNVNGARWFLIKYGEQTGFVLEGYLRKS